MKVFSEFSAIILNGVVNEWLHLFIVIVLVFIFSRKKLIKDVQSPNSLLTIIFLLLILVFALYYHFDFIKFFNNLIQEIGNVLIGAIFTILIIDRVSEYQNILRYKKIRNITIEHLKSNINILICELYEEFHCTYSDILKKYP